MQNSNAAQVPIGSNFFLESTQYIPVLDTIGGGSTASSSSIWWQSFIVPSTITPTRIDTFWANTGFFPGTYTFKIFEGQGEVGTVVYTKTLTIGAISGTYSLIDNTFPTFSTTGPSGGQYTLSIRHTDGNQQIGGFLYSVSDPYPNGRNNIGALFDYRVVIYTTDEACYLTHATIGRLTRTSSNGAMELLQKTGALVLPSLTDTQVSALNFLSNKVGGFLYNTTKKLLQFYSTVSSSFVPQTTFSITAQIAGAGNGTKTLIFNSPILRTAREMNFQVSGGVFDTTINYPTGASMTVNILKNGTTVGTQTFLGSTSTAPIRSLTNFSTTPIAFAPLDILTIQVVQASFGGNPDLSVVLTCNSI